jgi:DNA-binding SARP family transcriptional activator
MSITARLLGPPVLVRDEVVYAVPRGRKVWALFAYLALADQQPSRQQLMELLFPDAEDPASALRWNLSELRRLLGGPDTVGSGNTVALRLPEGSVIDVHVLLGGSSEAAVELPGLGRELIEGMNVDASPGFTAWLLGERRRLLALSGAVLREGALRALASGDARRAVELAARLVGAEPLNEDAHVLLIRAFAATGDEVAVERQLSASTELFQRELGVPLGPEVYEAARMEPARPAPATAGGRASLRALLESGEAAVSAGAVDVGVGSLRAAAVGAKDAGDTATEAMALLALGSALVHGTKGRDEEGSAALHRAITTAEAVGDRGVAASAHRELGYVELLRGDYPRAEIWLRTAADLADGDTLEMARIRAVTGACLTDVGAHDRARAEFDIALELSESIDHAKQTAWSTAMVGKSKLLCNELDLAEDALRRASDLAHAERWTAFLAFPEALLAEVWVRRGKLGEAAETFEHAFALGCQVDDACWEAYSVRGMGLLKAATGDLDDAVGLMEKALDRCARQRDTHLWVRAYVLDALSAIATRMNHPHADGWVTDLGSVAEGSGMREFSVHAYLCRRDLGDGSAADAARAVAVGIENPRLHELLDAEGPSVLDDLLGTG